MRRIGLAVFTVGLAMAPLGTEAQKAVTLPRIGILSAFSPQAEPASPQRTPFWQAMRELGWIEGQNIVVERRWAELRLDRLPALATELVRLKVELILTTAGAETIAAKRATKTIPIVMGSSLDAVEQGLVASLSRPGGNVTGVTSMTEELNSKRLEVLREAAPKVSRIALLKCKGALVGQGFGGMLDAARALGVTLQLLDVQEAEDYETAFAAAIRERVGAMVVLSCYSNAANAPRIVALASKHRLPAIASWRGWAESGGLMSYGPRASDMAKLTATYVDKILKGAKPADLPVEQPTKFELVINMKTAKALGLTIPPSVLGRADQVIQ
jgi:putative tryptophan/tyrosine transport system substrate-binding protein